FLVDVRASRRAFLERGGTAGARWLPHFEPGEVAQAGSAAPHKLDGVVVLVPPRAAKLQRRSTDAAAWERELELAGDLRASTHTGPAQIAAVSSPELRASSCLHGSGSASTLGGSFGGGSTLSGGGGGGLAQAQELLTFPPEKQERKTMRDRSTRHTQDSPLPLPPEWSSPSSGPAHERSTSGPSHERSTRHTPDAPLPPPPLDSDESDGWGGGFTDRYVQ
ncbi:hypothetical protein T492DRAFT_871289, partial [Pavlovales sp. CCMP2436]